jgi:hypothetical protein
VPKVEFFIKVEKGSRRRTLLMRIEMLKGVLGVITCRRVENELRASSERGRKKTHVEVLRTDELGGGSLVNSGKDALRDGVT